MEVLKIEFSAGMHDRQDFDDIAVHLVVNPVGQPWDGKRAGRPTAPETPDLREVLKIADGLQQPRNRSLGSGLAIFGNVVADVKKIVP